MKKFRKTSKKASQYFNYSTAFSFATLIFDAFPARFPLVLCVDCPPADCRPLTRAGI